MYIYIYSYIYIYDIHVHCILINVYTYQYYIHVCIYHRSYILNRESGLLVLGIQSRIPDFGNWSPGS